MARTRARALALLLCFAAAAAARPEPLAAPAGRALLAAPSVDDQLKAILSSARAAFLGALGAAKEGSQKAGTKAAPVIPALVQSCDDLALLAADISYDSVSTGKSKSYTLKLACDGDWVCTSAVTFFGTAKVTIKPEKTICPTTNAPLKITLNTTEDLADVVLGAINYVGFNPQLLDVVQPPLFVRNLPKATATLTIESITLDGNGNGAGVVAALLASLNLKNVNIVNAFLDNASWSLDEGSTSGAIFALATAVNVNGGSIQQVSSSNTGGSAVTLVPADIFINEVLTGLDLPQSSFTGSKVTFSSTIAGGGDGDLGSTISVVKTSAKALTVKCSNCVFSANEGPTGAVSIVGGIRVESTGFKAKALTVDLSGSTYPTVGCFDPVQPAICIARAAFIGTNLVKPVPFDDAAKTVFKPSSNPLPAPLTKLNINGDGLDRCNSLAVQVVGLAAVQCEQEPPL